MTRASALRINPQLTIPAGELRFTFVRSSGPGGQNVNKVASKAVLRWEVTASQAVSALADDVRERLLGRLSRRMTERGELLLTSQRHRDQAKNVDDCLDKLRELLLKALAKPRPRKKTRPSRASKEARLREKRATSEKKRRRSGYED